MKAIIDKHINIVAEDIKEAYRRKGMKASGQFEDSMFTKSNETAGEVWAEDYSEQLEHGRKKGKFPPLTMIEQWVKDKGLTYDIPLKSLVFLIARKISKEGWKRQGYGGVDLVKEVMTDIRVKKLLDDISTEYYAIITRKLEIKFALI